MNLLDFEPSSNPKKIKTKVCSGWFSKTID
jgi:hypothetical protein